MDLFKASRQWASRPADERFSSLEDLARATKHYADLAAEAVVPARELKVEQSGDADLALVGPTGSAASFTHWSFGQLAQRVGAPADYLRRLTPELAAANLNHGLDSRGKDVGDLKLLIHSNGSMVVRAFTGEGYGRIWNYEVAERLMNLQRDGWRVPPARPAFANQPGARPATEADVLGDVHGLSVKVGDLIAPAGLYASDHDVFMFLVNEDRRVNEPGNPEGLARGVFVENSEVGASSLRVTRFLYRHVCGNHIVWDAKDVMELAIRHVGDVEKKSSHFFAAIREYANASASDDEAKIARAYTYRLGDSKEAVLDAVFGKGILSRKQAAEAFTVAEDVEGLDGRTAWGLAQGVTRIATALPHADRRAELDRAAGKILRIAF